MQRDDTRDTREFDRYDKDASSDTETTTKATHQNRDEGSGDMNKGDDESDDFQER